MTNEEAINQALIAANAANTAGFKYTQQAFLDIAKTLQQERLEEIAVTSVCE
jgi:hypothetical protein